MRPRLTHHPARKNEVTSVSILTCCAWIPGVLAALFISSRQQQVIIVSNGDPQRVQPKSSVGTLLAGIILFVIIAAILTAAIPSFNQAKERAESSKKTPTPTPTASATPQKRTAQVMPTPLEYNPAKESMAAAVRRYPELSKADSPLNKAFVALFNDAKTKKSPILFQSDWPMRLADLATLSLKEKSR